jgi:hypothetical protein
MLLRMPTGHENYRLQAYCSFSHPRSFCRACRLSYCRHSVVYWTSREFLTLYILENINIRLSLLIICSFFVQVSTTQCIVGAVSGIGCVEGWRTVQWGSLAKVCVGWVVVFFTASVLSDGMFSFCYYKPSAMDPVDTNTTAVV